VCFVPLIKRGNSGRPSAMPNYFGFYGSPFCTFLYLLDPHSLSSPVMTHMVKLTFSIHGDNSHGSLECLSSDLQELDSIELLVRLGI